MEEALEGTSLYYVKVLMSELKTALLQRDEVGLEGGHLCPQPPPPLGPVQVVLLGAAVEVAVLHSVHWRQHIVTQHTQSEQFRGLVKFPIGASM